MFITRPSLRLKLTLWILAVFTIAFSGIMLGAWLLQRQTAKRELGLRLNAIARDVGEMMREVDNAPWRDRFDSLQPEERRFVVVAVRDAAGKVRAAPWLVDLDALPPVPDAEAGDLVIRDLPPEQAQRLIGRDRAGRLITYRFTQPDGGAGYIDLATTSAVFRDAPWIALATFVAAGIGALLASCLAGWLVAGLAVRPMKLLADAAEQVGPGDISGRIDLEGDEREIEQLRTALNQALARLEEGYRAQERFISDVAHDLKTPIAVMLTESQVLRSKRATREELEQYRDSTISEMHRLGGLVESFLTLARADQGEALARVVDVPIIDLIMEAVAECDREAEQQRVHLVATVAGRDGGSHVLRGDPDLLRTMLVNLIRNAIRHSPRRKAVDISARAAGGVVEISVRDRGPGVPEAFIERVFERFVQVASDQTSRRGTGLGLAIAKSVAQMHRGSIALENCRGGGCVFTVSIPLHSPDGHEPAPGPLGGVTAKSDATGG